MDIFGFIKGKMNALTNIAIIRIMEIKNKKRFKNIYNIQIGPNYDKFSIYCPEKESKNIKGSLLKIIENNNIVPKEFLLPGEPNEVKYYYKQLFPNANITTTGILNVDIYWDFEKDFPSDLKKYNLILSQAMLEHLINPYKHLNDLSCLLTTDGVLIVHTLLPGFDYHRYPVDCLRFYPDWFEEIAKRMNLKILDKYVRRGHIIYAYIKQNI